MAFNPLTQTFDIIEELRLQPGTSELSRAFVLNSELSGLSITYASWDPDSEEEDNGTTIIKPDGVEVGRWIVKESVTRQELSYNNNGGLSISNGNEVSLTNLRAQGINGNDSMDGSISSNFFPFIFSSSNTGWPVGAGSGIQMERRSTGSNRSGFRIFNREQGADTLYYQRKVAGDLTTWGDVETIPFTSQIYTRTQSEERFFGAWYNESGLLGGPQSVDLDAVAGLRAFRVSSSVPGLPAPLAGTNNAAVINLYQEANISPQLVIAVSGTDMSDNFWYRGRQGGDWYKVASTTYVDNAVEPAQQDLTFNAEATLSISDGNSVSINVVKTQTLNAGDTLTGTLGGTAFPFTFSGAQSGWAFNDGSGIQIERRHNDTSRSGFRLFNNVNSANALYYQRKAPGDLTTWSTVEQVAFHSQVYTQSQTNARFMGISFNEAIDLGSLQTSDLNEVNGARIFRVGSTVANLPTPLQGVNPSTVINLYGPSGTDCPQILMANSGTDVSDNFWYRGNRTSSWSRVASRQWVDTNYYLKTSADARFMGTGFNDSGSLGNWQTVSDLNSVVGARIFRIDSTSLNMPSPMQGVNPSTVINLYGPEGVDSPQMIFAASGDNMNNNFWYRNSQSDTWYQVADRAWTNTNFLLQSSVAGSITQTDVDNWNGSIGDPAWSEVTNKPTVIQDIEAGDVGLVSRLSISRPVQQNFAGDIDTVLTTGIGHVFASGSTNLPVEHNGTLYTGYHAGAANGGSTQIFVSTQSSGNMYFRRRHPNGTWYDWHRVLTETNAASIYLPLTGGTLTGDLTATQYKLSSLNTAPSSASDTGTTGEIRVAADYIYVCTATDTWVRAELTTW